MLHEVSRGGHAVLLFGGSRPTRVPWSSPGIEALAASAEEFWNEVPAMGPEVAALAPKYGIDPARPLATWLTDEDQARFAAAAEANGANVSLMAALRPWLAAQALSMAVDARLGLNQEHGAEAVLMARARQAGVAVKSEFATPEDVFAFFASMPPAAEVEYLRFTLYEVEAGIERVDAHADALERGDYSPIAEEAAMMRDRWPALYAHLAVARNEAWLPRFEAMFEARTRAFIVVGSGHLVGEEGLLATLPAAGFAVRRREA